MIVPDKKKNRKPKASKKRVKKSKKIKDGTPIEDVKMLKVSKEDLGRYENLMNELRDKYKIKGDFKLHPKSGIVIFLRAGMPDHMPRSGESMKEFMEKKRAEADKIRKEAESKARMIRADAELMKQKAEIDRAKALESRGSDMVDEAVRSVGRRRTRRPN